MTYPYLRDVYPEGKEGGLRMDQAHEFLNTHQQLLNEIMDAISWLAESNLLLIIVYPAAVARIPDCPHRYGSLHIEYAVRDSAQPSGLRTI